MIKSKGLAKIDIELYDKLIETERQFKLHSIMEYNPYYEGFITFYSRDAFDKKQLEKINKLEKESEELTRALKEASAKIQQLEQQKAMPYGLVVEKPNVKDLSIFRFIKLKLRG